MGGRPPVATGSQPLPAAARELDTALGLPYCPPSARRRLLASSYFGCRDLPGPRANEHGISLGGFVAQAKSWTDFGPQAWPVPRSCGDAEHLSGRRHGCLDPALRIGAISCPCGVVPVSFEACRAGRTR